MKKKAIFLFLLLIILFLFMNNQSYNLEDFNIERIYSDVDCNGNGIDDYSDIVIGARIDANKRVKYKSAYYDGGYPPDTEGVCTDLIWRAFKHAGYNLKELVDEDIQNYQEEYDGLDKVPDPNIDFRRVSNLKVFFQRNALNLTLDIKDIASFMPGDIVVFADAHIAIISDKRNRKGIPYLIHNAGQWKREDNTFEKWNKKYGISRHFRWENTICKEKK